MQINTASSTHRAAASQAAIATYNGRPDLTLADALTKVVLLQGPRAHGLVRRLGGRGFILHASAPAAELKCAA